MFRRFLGNIMADQRYGIIGLGVMRSVRTVIEKEEMR